MNLYLTRKYLRDGYTIGALFVDGKYLCDTIEDEVREEKIFGVTAIPYGKYTVELSQSPKFKRELPLILDVPNFTGIRIHRGNTAEDSHGCILPGENKIRGGVINSTKYEKILVQVMKLAIKAGQDITIEIK